MHKSIPECLLADSYGPWQTLCGPLIPSLRTDTSFLDALGKSSKARVPLAHPFCQLVVRLLVVLLHLGIFNQ